MSENQNKLKLPPNSKDSEMMVLGCMLTSVNSLNIAADSLENHDFYYSEHRLIFEVLKDAYKNDKPADVLLISEELKRQNKLDTVGGISYITTLAQYAGTSAYIEEYVELIKNKSMLRRMIQTAQIIEKDALEEPADVNASLDNAQKLFFQIGQSSNAQAGVLVSEILEGTQAQAKIPYLKELEARQERFSQMGPEEAKITGIPTRFMDLDKLMNGLNNSHLIILAARPAMGKTALALNIAENVCFKHHVPVGIFSLEMTSEQLVHRIVCSQSEVESDKIRTGSLNAHEFQRVVEAVNGMSQHVMLIDDQPGLKITDLRARARRMKESHGIGLLMVDYLQLLSGSGSNRGAESRQNEISEISRMLKNLARELDIPVLCIAQLSRKVEERAGHRPLMSDLRESGCLQGDTLIQDALTGKRHTIKELAKRKKQTPLQVHAINPNSWKLEARTMTKVFSSGKKMLYMLTTRSGRTIQASQNHPFLKLEGWTALEDLKKGDRIAIPRKLEIHKPKKSLSKEELTLLAHLIGDGCILEKQPYHYTSASEDNLKAVQEAAQKLFNIECRLVKQGNWYHLYLPAPFKLTHGKKHPITTWFEKLGIQRVRSYEKVLPESLFEHDEKEIAHFLKHLWSTDGNISSKQMKGRKPSAALYYASSSPTLAQQVQHLLLRLGILSAIRKVPSKKNYRLMYHVDVQESGNQLNFLRKIGAFGPRQKMCDKLIQDLQQIESNPNTDVIPKEVWPLHIRIAKDAALMGWRDVCKKLDTSYCGSTLFKHGPSRKRLKTIGNILKSKELDQLADSDVFWDEILSITPLHEEEVFDATVEGVHNFVANDIIVHNSIEQDADIIMMLLRREYYDPNDRPGTAQIFIAKNRHGGVGEVTMTYRKELAQFANYVPINSHQRTQDQEAEEAFRHFSP